MRRYFRRLTKRLPALVALVTLPAYPIPPEAITQARWIEGGDPGNVDRRSSQDRHLLIVDRDRNYL